MTEDLTIRAWPTVAITLIQPWATLIMHFGKNIENRTWKPSERRLPIGAGLWIHAGAKLDREAHEWALAEVESYREHCIALSLAREPIPMKPGTDIARGLPTRAMLGHVRYDGQFDPDTMPPNRWFMGPHGMMLSNPHAFSKPVECLGALQTWTVGPAMLEKLVAAAVNP